MLDQELLTSQEAAQLLRVCEETLSKWRRTGHGPSFSRLGHRTVRYDRASVSEWLRAQSSSRKEAVHA